MYLFGFPEGLAGGSKETSYLTNYNTSHGTSRTTSYGTGWHTARTTTRTTSRGTSRSTTVSTSWNSVGNTSWNTSQTTNRNTDTLILNAFRKTINTTTVGSDLSTTFYIGISSSMGVCIFSSFGWYNKTTLSLKTSSEGYQFLDTTGVSRSPTTYQSVGWGRAVSALNLWVDGVRMGAGTGVTPTYDQLYNASEIIIEFQTGMFDKGFNKSKIKMGSTRMVRSGNSLTHFYANTILTYYDPASNPTYEAIYAPTDIGSGWPGVSAASSVPYGTHSTSFSTAGPMTYKSTTFALSRNTAFATSYSTSYGTSYGTSVYTSRGTSRGTSFTTNYGTSHTTDHITYG